MDKKLIGFSIFLIFVLVVVVNVSPTFFGGVVGEDFHFRLYTIAYNKVIHPGEEVIINSNVVKFGYTERIDVSLETEIKDPAGVTIDKSMETFAIETQVNIIKRVFIEENSPPGLYTIQARLIYNDEEEATSQESFRVEEKAEKISNESFILFSLIATLILLTIYLLVPFYMKRKI